MADDLAALLRREIGSWRWTISPPIPDKAMDALADRLAEVVRPMFENLTVEAVLLAKRERDAARKSESEAAWLLERIVTYSDADDNLGDIHREARAYLARREEAPHA